jgi:hypothetical protein
VETSVTYFDQRGKVNTKAVFELARKRAQELGITQIVVPSTGGAMALMAPDALLGLDVIVVSHSTGFTEPWHQEMPESVVEDVRRKGARVVTATHAFGGVGRSVRKKFGTWEVEEIIAQTLKRLGEGVKVAVEISLMAADAGCLKQHSEVIALGGTGRGLDTALVLRPTHAQTFFELEILEIVCKPRQP